MVLQTEKRSYTTEEYLELEEKAEFRNEYINGEIRPMTGGTTNHNKIAGNFYKRFPDNINGQDYDTYINDVKLWISQFQIYTYPDIIIIQGEPIYQGTKKITVTNPLVIVEVLSNSTKNYDKTDKFKYYRSIPSFQEYILIDQYSFSIEQYSKQAEAQWLFQEYEGEDTILKLNSVDFEIVLKDIYAKVNFEDSEE
jgi:Uma2 family endonuclease